MPLPPSADQRAWQGAVSSRKYWAHTPFSPALALAPLPHPQSSGRWEGHRRADKTHTHTPLEDAGHSYGPSYMWESEGNTKVQESTWGKNWWGEGARYGILHQIPRNISSSTVLPCCLSMPLTPPDPEFSSEIILQGLVPLSTQKVLYSLPPKRQSTHQSVSLTEKFIVRHSTEMG